MLDQDEQLMGLLELVSVVKRYHDIPLQEYGKLSEDEFKWIDHISGKNKLKVNQ